MSRFAARVAGLIVAAAILFGVRTGADAAAYIKFDGVDGETKDKGHDKWSDLLSVSDVILDTAAATGACPGAPTDAGTMTVTIRPDAGTAALLALGCSGDQVPAVQIDVAGPTKRDPVTRYELQGVTVTGVTLTTVADKKGGPVSATALELDYSSILVTTVGP
jgi:type VI secretion system secreted protein Hcp